MQPSPQRNERLGLLLGFVGVCFYGLTLPTTRIAVAEIDPWFVVFGRGFLACGVAALLLWAAGEKWPARRLLWPLVVSSAGVVVGFPVGVTLAMQYAPASHGAVVLALLPLATAVAGVVIGGERPSLGFWLCAVAGTAAIVVFATLQSAGLDSLHAADLLLLLAVASSSVGYAYGALLTREIGGWRTICWSLMVAAPVLGGGTLALLLLDRPIGWNASAEAWACFLYLAFGTQIVAFFAWYRGLAIGGVARVSQIQLTQPFITLTAAAIMLGETVTPMHVGFAALVVAIVAVGRRMRVRPSAGDG